MASLKLLYRDEWRRLPRAPDTWKQLEAELREMYALERPGVVEIGGPAGTIAGQKKYRELLARAEAAGTKLLKLEVVLADTGPKLIATFHLPECSKCLGRLTGREGMFQLACGHVFCTLCSHAISLKHCPYDSEQPQGAEYHDLAEKVMQLEQEVRKISPLRYYLPAPLMQVYEEVCAKINVQSVPCVFFKNSQKCPDEEHCRYQHLRVEEVKEERKEAVQADKTTSFERVNMADASSDSLPVESRQVGTVSVVTEEFGTHTNPIDMQDQVTTTVDHQDTGSDALIYVDQGNVTVPLEFESKGTSSHQMVNVQQETLPTVMESKQIGPGGFVSEFSQSENQPALLPPVGFLESLRTSIRMAVTESSFSLSDRHTEEFPVTCSECRLTPIPGYYFHCSNCPAILCPACEETSEHPHPMYKVKHLSQAKNFRIPPQSNNTKNRLMSMGFKDDERLEHALRESAGDFDRSVELLLSR